MENRHPYEITSGFVERSGIFSYTQQVQRLNQLHRKVPTLCQSISQHASKQISGSLAHEYSFDRGMYAETNDYSLTVTRKGWRRHSFKDSGCIPNHPIRWIPKAHSQVVSEGSNAPDLMLKVERSQHNDMTSPGARYAERLGTIIKDLKDRENQAFNVLNHQKIGSLNRGIEGISAISLPEGNPAIKQTSGICKNTMPVYVSTQPVSKNKTGTLIREKDTAHQAKSSVWPDAQFQPEKLKQISVPFTNLQYRSDEKQDVVVGLESLQSGTNVVESSQVINAVSKDYGAAYVTGIMDKQSKYNQDWETKMYIMSKIAEYNKLSNQKATHTETPNETVNKCLKSDEKLTQSHESGFEKEKERKMSSAMFKEAINKSLVYSTKQNVKNMQNQSEISVPVSKSDISSYDNTSIFKTRDEKPFKTTCTSVNNPPKVNQNVVYVEKQFHQVNFGVSSENKHVSSFRSGPNSTSNNLALNCMASKNMKLKKCSPNNSHSTKEKLVEVKHADENLYSCFDSKGLGTINVCKPMVYGKDSRIGQIRAADKTPILHIYNHSTESVDVSWKDNESRNGKPKPSKRVRFDMNTCKVIEPVTSAAKTLDSTYENRTNKANNHNSRELSKMKEKFREDILQKNPLFGLRKTYSSDDIKSKAKLFKKNLNESVSVKGKNSNPSSNSESNKNLAKTQGLCMKSSGENIKVSTEKLKCTDIQLQVETVRDSRMAKSGPIPEVIRSAGHQTIEHSSDLLQFSPTSDIVRKKHLDVVHQGNSKDTAKPMFLDENKMSRKNIIVQEKNGKEFKSEKSERKKSIKTVYLVKKSESASVSNEKSEMLKKLLIETVKNKSNLKHKNKMNTKKDNVSLVFEKSFDLPNQSKNNKVNNKPTSMKKNLEEIKLMKQHGHKGHGHGHGISENRQINPKLHNQGKRKFLSPEFNNQPNLKVRMQAPTSLCNIYEHQNNQTSVASTYKSQFFAPGNVYPSCSEIPGTIKPKTQTSQSKVYNVTSKQPLIKSKPGGTPILDNLHHISSCTPSLEVMSNISTSSRKAGVHHTNHLSSAAKQLSLPTSAIVGETHSTQSLPIQRSYFIATTGYNLINEQSTMTSNSNTIANSNKYNNLNSNKSSIAASPNLPIKRGKMDNLKNGQAPVAKKQQFDTGPSKMYNGQSSQLCRPHIRAEVRKFDERILQQALSNKNDVSVGRDRSNQTSYVLTSNGKIDATRTKQSNVKQQNSTALKKVNVSKIHALVQPPFPVSSCNSEVHGTNKLSLSVNSYDQGVHVKIDNAHNKQLPHTVKSSDKVACADFDSTQSNHLPSLVKCHNQDAPTKVDNAGNNQLLSSVRFIDSFPAAKVDNSIHNSHQLQPSVKSQDKVVPARAVNTHNQLSSVKFNDQTAPAKVDNIHTSHQLQLSVKSQDKVVPARAVNTHNQLSSGKFNDQTTPKVDNIHNNHQLQLSVKSQDTVVPARAVNTHNQLSSVKFNDQTKPAKVDNIHSSHQLQLSVKSQDKVAPAWAVNTHNQLSSVKFNDQTKPAKVDNIHSSHQLQLSVKSQDKVVPARAVNTHNQLSSVKFNDQTAPAKVDNIHSSKQSPSVKSNYQDGPAKVYIIHKSSSLVTSSHQIAPAAVDTIHNSKASSSLKSNGNIAPAKADIMNNNHLSPSVKSNDQEVPAKVDIKHKELLQSLKPDYLVATANAVNTCNNQLSPSVKSNAEVAPAKADSTLSQLSLFNLVKSKDETTHIKADAINTKLSPSVKSIYQVACTKVDDAHSNRLSPTAKSNDQDASIKNDQNNNQLSPSVKSNGQDVPIKNDDQTKNQVSPSVKSNGQDASIKNEDENNNQLSPSVKSNGQDAPIKNEQNNNQLSPSVKSNGQYASIKNDDQNNNQLLQPVKSNGQVAPIKNDQNNQLSPSIKSIGQDATIKNDDQNHNQLSPSVKSKGQYAPIKNDDQNNQLLPSVKSYGQDASIKNDDRTKNQLSPSVKSYSQDAPIKNYDQNNDQLLQSVKSNGQDKPIKNDDRSKNQLSPSVKSYSQDASVKNKDQNNNQLSQSVNSNGQDELLKNEDQNNNQLSPSVNSNGQDELLKNEDQNNTQLSPSVNSNGQDELFKNEDQNNNQLSPSVNSNGQDELLKDEDQNNTQLSPSVNSNGQDEPLKNDDRNNNQLSPSVNSNGQDKPLQKDVQNNQLSPSVKSGGPDLGLNFEDFEKYLPEGSLFSFSPDLTDLTNFILDYSADGKKFDEVANLSPPVLSPAVPTEYNRYTERDPTSHVVTTVINENPTFTSTTNNDFETAIKLLQKDSISAADGVSSKSNANEIQFHEVCGEGDLSLTDKLSKAQCKTVSQSGADGQEQRRQDDIVSSVASSCELLRKPIDMKSAETQCEDLVGRKVSLNSKSVEHKSNKKETVKCTRMITRSATRQASKGVFESKNSKIGKVQSIVQNASHKQRQPTVINTVNKFETGLSSISTANSIVELSIKTPDPSIDVGVNDDGAEDKKGRVARKRKSSMELPMLNVLPRNSEFVLTDAEFLGRTFNKKTSKKRCRNRVCLLGSENVQAATIKPKALGMAKTRSFGHSERSRAKIDTKAGKCLSSQVNTELCSETKLVGKRGKRRAEADVVTTGEKCNQSMQDTSGVPFVQPTGGSFNKKRAKFSHHEMNYQFANSKGTDAQNSKNVNLTKRKANKVTMRGNKKTGPELKIQLTDIMVRNKTSRTLHSKKDCKRPRTDIKNSRTKVDISGSCITGETHTKMKPSLKPRKGHKKGKTSADRKERINTVTRVTTTKDVKQLLKNKTFADEFRKCTLCDVKIHPSRKLSHFKQDHPRACDVCHLELPTIVSIEDLT